MRLNRFFLVVGLLFLLVVLPACQKDKVTSAGAADVLSGEPLSDSKAVEEQLAPDFLLSDINGQSYRLSDLKGKVVILNFFATWCPPCREEMPSMEELHKRYGDQGLVMLAVNVEEDSVAKVTPFLAKTPYSFPILVNGQAVAEKNYGVFRYPETFIIDKNGVIVEKVIGGRDWLGGSLFQFIQFLLGG